MLSERLLLGWHELLFDLAGRLHHPREGVSLRQCSRALQLHHHALGGDPARRITADDGKRHRLPRPAASAPEFAAWLDREQIHLPRTLNRYASAELNRELYFWLAAFLAFERQQTEVNRGPAGIRHLLQGVATSARILQRFPGLDPRYRRLCAAELEQRRHALPKFGAGSSRVHQLEAAIRFCLGASEPPPDPWLHDAVTCALEGEVVKLPERWRNRPTAFLSVPLWGRAARDFPGLRLRWLKRQTRRSARGRQKPLAAPRFDLHQEVTQAPDFGIQQDGQYPEWDYQRGCYRDDWCRVEERTPPEAPATRAGFDPDVETLARRVRLQFEALRQVRGWIRHLDDGEEVDLNACVDAFADRHGAGRTTSALYRSRNLRWRDLGVTILMDTSRSTQAWVGDRRVIEIERQSMAALAEALSAIGDDFALYGFSSDSRLRVRCDRLKSFDESYGAGPRRRLLALKPADYTRMGAAIRHVGAGLKQRGNRQKLLLLLTDGRPHDPTDGYEGKYAAEDTRRALQELRVQGIHCYGLAIDQRGRDYLPEIFGPGRYAVLSRPQSLPQLLPKLYAQITALTD